jgi:hypothetical protein
VPRCSTHCPPPRNGGAVLLAVIVAGVVIVAAGRTAIAHVLTIVVVAAGIVAGVAIAGLATAAVLHLRSKSRGRRPTSPELQARPPASRTIRATPATQAALTSGPGRAATGRHEDRGSGHYRAPATEQHLHLHLHGASTQELAHLLSPPHPPRDPES